MRKKNRPSSSDSCCNARAVLTLFCYREAAGSTAIFCGVTGANGGLNQTMASLAVMISPPGAIFVLSQPPGTTLMGKAVWFRSAVGFVFTFLAFASVGHTEPLSSFTDALQNGKPLIDIRARYEGVSDDNCAACAGQDADARTLRARIGYQRAKWNGLSALVTFDQVWSLGPQAYNSKTNGHTSYPVVADPAMTALDRAQLTYDTGYDTVITGGRQKIVLGDARFIGNVGFRQHEQTFDAVKLVNTSLPDTTLTYAWIGGVNRIFGPDSNSGPADGHFNSDSHIVDAVYSGAPHLTLEGYVYLLDLRQAAAASTATYGFHVTWSHEFAGTIAVKLGGAFAHQTDYARNPNSVSLNYWMGEGQLSHAGIKGSVGYEVMEGNGVVGFSTPLATLHAFDGWADLFLVTPKNGIDDLHIALAGKFKNAFGIVTFAPKVVYHDFSADRTSANLGEEWDFALNAAFGKHFALNASYADYSGAGGFKDKSITWLTASYRL